MRCLRCVMCHVCHYYRNQGHCLVSCPVHCACCSARVCGRQLGLAPTPSCLSELGVQTCTLTRHMSSEPYCSMEQTEEVTKAPGNPDIADLRTGQRARDAQDRATGESPYCYHYKPINGVWEYWESGHLIEYPHFSSVKKKSMPIKISSPRYKTKWILWRKKETRLATCSLTCRRGSS